MTIGDSLYYFGGKYVFTAQKEVGSYKPYIYNQLWIYNLVADTIFYNIRHILCIKFFHD